MKDQTQTHRKIEEKKYLCNLQNYFLFYLHGTLYDVRLFFIASSFLYTMVHLKQNDFRKILEIRNCMLKRLICYLYIL